MNWLQINDLVIDGRAYELEIAFNIELSHFTYSEFASIDRREENLALAAAKLNGILNALKG